MSKKTKYGKLEVPVEESPGEKITAHISIRLPMVLIKDLKRLSLNGAHEGKYQTLIREILTEYVGTKNPASEKKLNRV